MAFIHTMIMFSEQDQSHLCKICWILLVQNIVPNFGEIINRALNGNILVMAQESSEQLLKLLQRKDIM